MADARLRVVSVGPLVSIQDSGRFGRMRFGVPASGPMDRLSHAAANSALGNEPETTAIEVSLGGVALECLSGAVTIAVAGGGFSVDHAGRQQRSWSAFTVRTGQQVTVKSGNWGSWAYIAVAGVLDVPDWLGSTATHSQSGLGGGSLTHGGEIRIQTARTIEAREGQIPIPGFARPSPLARVVIGPQDHHFEHDAMTTFCTSTYSLSDAYDRMGVRLVGPSLSLRAALSIPSEPIVRGSIQVAGDGVPTVLLADHQTTGGYPKIATLISSDLDQFSQLRAGDEVRFAAITPQDAILIARARHELTTAYLEAISKPGRTLDHRLRAENLISGVVSTREPRGQSD